jgi:hypothetical protein
VSALITRLEFPVPGTAGGGPVTPVFRIGTTGYIYGMVFQHFNSPYGTRVATFSVNPSTGVLTQIAVTAIGATSSTQITGYQQHNIFNVAGNVWAVFGSQTHSGQWYAVKTFSVSLDGLTISLIHNYEAALSPGTGGIKAAAVKLSNNYYAVLTNPGSGANVEIRTYNITNGGTVTLVDTEVLEATTGSSQRCDIIPLAGTVYLCGYSTTGVQRLRSINISAVGIVGATIDTDDTLLGAAACWSLRYVAGFIIMGTTSALKTFAMSLDGTIGALIDSVALATSNFTYTGIGNIYHGVYTSLVASIDVITPAPAVETLGFSDQKHDRFTAWGNITEVGVATAYGFEWSTVDGNFENQVPCLDPIIAGIYNVEITGLTYNTWYKFRAIIGDGTTFNYGAEKTVKTAFPVPECSTDPASDAGDHFIDAVGIVKTDGGVSPIDRYGMVYGNTNVEDMLGRFADDIVDYDYSPQDSIDDGYDGNEQVEGTLVNTLLSTACLAGQPDVQVLSAAGIIPGMAFRVQDTNFEEDLIVDHVVGLVVTMTTNLVHPYTMGAYLGQKIIVKLRNLEYGKRYFFRFWTHNEYGYGWGAEMIALTSDTVNIMCPTATASKGIRFCIPGKVNFPPTGMWYDTRHHLLVLSADSYFVDEGAFGWVKGKYVCERQYYSEATNVDLYTMSNPVRRTGTILKVKWKARIGNNDYGLGNYHKRVINNGATSLTGGDIGSSSALGWVCEIFTTNPWTTNPWAVAECDALLMGISIRSGTGFEIPLCDCIEGRVVWANAAVTTKAPRYCTPTSVQFNALVTEDECEDCTVYFEYGPTIAYGSTTTPQAAVKGQAISDTIAYTAPPPGTYYHYRAVIVTACGETFYGADMLYPNGLIIEIAFVQSILTVAPTWTDITLDCQALHINRGRVHALDKVQAGTAWFQLNNESGNWYRYNTAGAYYIAGNEIKPLTLMRCRYSYNGIRHCYYGVVESFDPKWLGLYGFNPVMVASCVDIFKSFAKYRIVNADTALTLDATTGLDYVILPSTNGYVEGQTVKLYDSVGSENLIIQQVVPAVNTIIFTTNIVGNYLVSNGAKLKKWPSVLSGLRIHDICLEVRWPLALTSLDAGQVAVSEITPEAGGDNALSAMQAATKAEDGNLFIAATGLLTFHDNLARTKTPLHTSQAIFADDTVQLGYFDVEMADDDEFIYNECAIIGDDIGEQVMLDSAYQLEQGPRVVPDMTGSIIKNASDAIAQAFVKVERYKDSKPRCKALIIRPDGDPDNLYPVALGNDLGSKITFQLNSTRNPALINQDYHIEGIVHDWAKKVDLWETKLQLWGVNKYRVFKPTHDGYLFKIDDVTNYAAAQGAANADIAYNDTAIMEVGQWDEYAGAIWLSSRVERAKLRFDTTPLATAIYPPVRAFLLLYLQGVHVGRAWDLTLVIADNLGQPLTVPDYGLLLPHVDSLGSIAMPSVAGQWLAIELNSTGLAYVSYTGNTDIGLRSSRDIAIDDPGANLQEWATLGAKNSAYSPMLIVQVS